MSEVIVIDQNLLGRVSDFLKYQVLVIREDTVNEIIKELKFFLNYDLDNLPDDLESTLVDLMYDFIPVFTQLLKPHEIVQFANDPEGNAIIEIAIKLTTPEGRPGPRDMINRTIQAAKETLKS